METVKMNVFIIWLSRKWTPDHGFLNRTWQRYLIVRKNILKIKVFSMIRPFHTNNLILHRRDGFG